MCTCKTVTLESLDGARLEIGAALASGDVGMALAVSQCLWGLCRNADEHRVRLDEVLVLAGNFHEHLSLEDRSQLAEGLSEIKLEATKECLLAVA